MTEYIGEYQAGDHLPASLQTVNAVQTKAAPTLTPNVTIYDPAGAFVEFFKIAAKDHAQQAGFFQEPRKLGSLYGTAGTYAAHFSWITGGVTFSFVDTFEVVAGGDVDGAIIGMSFFERPEASHLVYMTESGKLMDGRNPR